MEPPAAERPLLLLQPSVRLGAAAGGTAEWTHTGRCSPDARPGESCGPWRRLGWKQSGPGSRLLFSSFGKEGERDRRGEGVCDGAVWMPLFLVPVFMAHLPHLDSKVLGFVVEKSLAKWEEFLEF